MRFGAGARTSASDQHARFVVFETRAAAALPSRVCRSRCRSTRGSVLARGFAPSGLSAVSCRPWIIRLPRASRYGSPGRTMDLVYGLPLIAALVLAWLAARHVANRAKRQRELLRRQKQRSRSRYRDGPQSASSRSDMRSTDAPVTVVDKIRKRESVPKGDGNSKPPRDRG